MLPKFVDAIKNNNTLKKSQGFKEITKWYHKAEESKDTLLKNQPLDKKDFVDLAFEVKTGKDSFLSKLTNIIVEKLVDQIKIPFVEMTLDNIRIKTHDNPSAKIDTTVELNLLKPYIEFILKINKMEMQPRVKIDFQIDSKVTISDTTVSANESEILIESGMLEAVLTLSFMDLDLSGIKIKKQFTIDEVPFKKNLKGFRFPKPHSKKCPNCNLIHSFNDEKCKNCKHDLA